MKHLKIAATADGGLIIEGYGVPFGGPIKGKDLHGQYFSKKTDFALDLIPDGQRPLLFQHGLDSAVDTAVIGRWGVKKIDDGGVWVRAQLDARSEYINEIKELVNQDALGFSSGTMGHLVKVSSKTGEILKWALVELSLTPNPANPNAYIVRANKSAAAHVKSLFATKHGDHDQSEHGSWATGGGAGDKEKDKGNDKSDTDRGRGSFQYGKDKWERPGFPKNVAITSMERDKYDRVILTMPDELRGGNKSEADGMNTWTAVMQSKGNGWEDYGPQSGLDIPFIPADNIQSADQWRFAFGYSNLSLAEIGPSEGNNGETIPKLDYATSTKEDAVQLRELLTDSNFHGQASTVQSLITKWDEFGPGSAKKTLRIKRSTKHGDHDQSEHGNRDGASSGATDKFGRAAAHPGYETEDQAYSQSLLLARAVEENAGGLAITNTTSGTEELSDGRAQAFAFVTAKAPQSVDKIIRHFQGLGFDAQKDPAGSSRGVVIKPGAGSSSDGPDDNFNDFMAGYDVPGYPKSYRSKSTKHGDHDQSEHGNWATGGGPDKGGNSERDKHDPELSKGAWHGMQNIATDATNIQKYTSTIGDFAREMANDMQGDGMTAAAASWEQVARHAMDIGGTAYTVEESVRENPHGESARQVVNSIDQNAQTMDQSRIVLREAIRIAQNSSFNPALPEEVSNALFKLDSSVTAVRYNSGFITQQQSSEFGPKTFRVKRSTKHGDHDQSEHGNRDGAGAANNGVSEETQKDIDTLAEEVKDLDSSFEDLNDVRGFGVTVDGKEMGILEFNTSEGTQGGTNYFMTAYTYNNDIEGVPGPEHAFVTLSEDETYDAMDSQELKDYLAAKLSGAPDDEVATAYDKLVRLADKNYKEANDTDEGVLGLD